MTCQLVALCIDANDPLRLARFWSGVLGWEMAGDSRDGVALVPGDDTGFRIRFFPVQGREPGLNLGHLHLTSTSLEDQQQTVARSLGLGARHVDIGQQPEEGHVVLADPEGNDFCVIEPGNNWRTLNAAATPPNRTALTRVNPDPEMVTVVLAAPWGRRRRSLPRCRPRRPRPGRSRLPPVPGRPGAGPGSR